MRQHPLRMALTMLSLFTWLTCSACSDDTALETIDAGEPEPVFDAGDDADRNQVKPGELCDRLATVQCAGEAFCCHDPGRSFKSCKKTQLSACKSMLRIDEIAMNSSTGYDAEHAQDAFAELEKLAKKCDPSIAAWGASIDGLRGMLQGTIASGDNCAPRGPATDTAIAGAALVSCEQPETYACQPSGEIVAGKLDWTCDEKSAVGGPCFSDYNCELGSYCDNLAQRLEGATCKVRRAEGEACKFPSQCESLFCIDGECVAATKKTAYCLPKN